ncbi:MAG: aminotransferase class III-fold pyridoxal phosphate-dependent enzyme [Pseudomonadales bacterium]
MSHVLHRSLLSDPPMAVRGDGPYIIDADGSRYFDACGGAAVSNLGHNHAHVVTAIRRQAQALPPYAHTAFFTTQILEELANTFVTQTIGMDKVLFVSGGSEAIEAGSGFFQHGPTFMGHALAAAVPVQEAASE